MTPFFFPLYNELAQVPGFLFSFGGSKRTFPFPAVSDNLKVPVRRDVNCYCVKILAYEAICSFLTF